MYKLTTNEGTRLVRASETQLREQMWEYVRARRAEGMELATIKFCWCPVRVEKL